MTHRFIGLVLQDHPKKNTSILSRDHQEGLDRIFETGNWPSQDGSRGSTRIPSLVILKYVYKAPQVCPMCCEAITMLLGGLEPWNFMTFPSYWECHHPNWRTPSLFRGVGQPSTRMYSPQKYHWIVSEAVKLAPRGRCCFFIGCGKCCYGAQVSLHDLGLFDFWMVLGYQMYSLAI
jgi:hypothetical protein